MKRNYIALAILLLSLLVPLASADMGPKGTVQFNLIYETSEPVTLIDSRLIKYEDELCLNETELSQFERFGCAQKECRARMFSGGYNRIIINFSDRERQSNVFNISEYRTVFDVHVTDSELIVEETTVSFYTLPGFALFFILNILLELIIALIFIAVMDKPMKVIAAVAIANSISFPALWQLLAFGAEFSLGAEFLLLFEALIVLFEGLFIYYFMKKVIPIYQLLILSLIMNLCSFIFGDMLVYVLNWGVVSILPLIVAIIVLSVMTLTHLKKRCSARFIRVFTISIMVLACVVAGLLVMGQMNRFALLSAHKISCEPEYYANVTAEELREFPQLANAIKHGKFVEMKRVEADLLLDCIQEGKSEQHTSSSPQKLYVRVKDEYYEVRTTRI
ncbi:MAG: hypothetical protein U9N61_11140 [Euryarchaeota archaeon]|nr:hypothetical protein [Euryarchaeota archaeon]